MVEIMIVVEGWMRKGESAIVGDAEGGRLLPQTIPLTDTATRNDTLPRIVRRHPFDEGERMGHPFCELFFLAWLNRLMCGSLVCCRMVR